MRPLDRTRVRKMSRYRSSSKLSLQFVSQSAPEKMNLRTEKHVQRNHLQQQPIKSSYRKVGAKNAWRIAGPRKSLTNPKREQCPADSNTTMNSFSHGSCQGIKEAAKATTATRNTNALLMMSMNGATASGHVANDGKWGHRALPIVRIISRRSLPTP